jgi:hypothetical protein
VQGRAGGPSVDHPQQLWCAGLADVEGALIAHVFGMINGCDGCVLGGCSGSPEARMTQRQGLTWGQFPKIMPHMSPDHGRTAAYGHCWLPIEARQTKDLRP